MYPTSVKNLYIGKSGIDFLIRGQIHGIIGEVLVPYDGPGPDYYLMNGYWNDNTFLINPIGTELYTLWVTGIPLGESIESFLIPGNVYHSTFQDTHRIYLFQVTKQIN